MRYLRSALALAFLVSISGPIASAQTGSTPQVKASVAPAAETDGACVIQLGNGYARYQPDGDEAAAKGGVSVEPTRAAPTPEQRPPEARAVPQPEGAPPAIEPDPCRTQEELLAQRLLELRGVRVDQKSALLAWSQLDASLLPFTALATYGRPIPLAGGAFLANVLGWDLTSRQLTESLARCMAQE